MWQEIAKVINRQNGSNHHRDRQIAAKRGREPQGGGRKETAGAAGHCARAGARGPATPTNTGAAQESARRRGEREAPKKKGGGHTTSKQAPAAPRREKRKGKGDETEEGERQTGGGQGGRRNRRRRTRRRKNRRQTNYYLRSMEYGGGVGCAGWGGEQRMCAGVQPPRPTHPAPPRRNGQRLEHGNALTA